MDYEALVKSYSKAERKAVIAQTGRDAWIAMGWKERHASLERACSSGPILRTSASTTATTGVDTLPPDIQFLRGMFEHMPLSLVAEAFTECECDLERATGFLLELMMTNQQVLGGSSESGQGAPGRTTPAAAAAAAAAVNPAATVAQTPLENPKAYLRSLFPEASNSAIAKALKRNRGDLTLAAAVLLEVGEDKRADKYKLRKSKEQ